jgi:hypothetical protein
VDDLLAWVVFLVGCAAMLALVRRLLAPRAAVGRAADRDEPARLTEACR